MFVAAVGVVRAPELVRVHTHGGACDGDEGVFYVASSGLWVQEETGTGNCWRWGRRRRAFYTSHGYIVKKGKRNPYVARK